MDVPIIEAMRWWERRGKKRHADSREKNPSDWRHVAIGNEALAQELTAQVFSRAERLIKAHRQAGPFRLWLRTLAMMTVARQRRRGPDADRGLQSAGCPAPLRPIRPTLLVAVALPLPPVDDGPGIVYALGRPV